MGVDDLQNIQVLNKLFSEKELELSQKITSLVESLESQRAKCDKVQLEKENAFSEKELELSQKITSLVESLESQRAKCDKVQLEKENAFSEKERSLRDLMNQMQTNHHENSKKHLVALVEREKEFRVELKQVLDEKYLITENFSRKLEEVLNEKHNVELRNSDLIHLLNVAQQLESQLRNEIVMASQMLMDITSELEKLKRSFTYRLTAPLRGIYEIFIPPKATREIGKFSFPSLGNLTNQPSIIQPMQEIPMPSITPTVAATSLDELFAYHDADFIHCAYLTLIGRAPDPEGMRYYLGRLRQGISKIVILQQFRSSKECIKGHALLSSIDKILLKYKISKIPLVNRLYSLSDISFELQEVLSEIRKSNINAQELLTLFQSSINQQTIMGIVEESQVKRVQQTTAEYQDAIKPLVISQTVAVNPKFSIIVLQYHKSDLTANCIRSLLRFTNITTTEIIVIDNGSSKEHIDNIFNEFGDSIRLIEIGVNRYFGEANNIGVELAKGEFVVLMNNDIVVTSGWLEKLYLNLNDELDVVGPCFLYPDGIVQECGAYINSDGTSIQQFKNGNIADLPENPFESDYISAATLLLHKKTFLMVGGFDLCYEPAYYEDVDLCLKIKTYGGRVICEPNVKIYHNENATSSDQSLGLKLNNIVEINKSKFIDRWGEYLANRISSPIESIKVMGSKNYPFKILNSIKPLNEKAKALLYSPYALTPGGGEKYLLTFAQELANKYEVTLAFPFAYSRTRLHQMESYLNIDLSNIQFSVLNNELKNMNWELCVILGNSIMPPFNKLAPVSFYICQFPFDRMNYKNKPILYSSEYHYLCYSDFVKSHIIENNSIKDFNVSILAPVIQLFQGSDKKEKLIVSVGRFFTGGHCKNQHLLIEAFRLLTKNSLFKDWKLVLIGSTRPESEHREYFKQCVDASMDINIEIIPDASGEVLADIYSRASIYWHASGLNIDELEYPERLEHFGITPLEAASAGCIVFVPNKGGPKEIASKAPNGFHTYSTIEELVELTMESLKNTLLEKSDEVKMRKFISSFSLNLFSEKLHTIIDKKVIENSYNNTSIIYAADTKVQWSGWSDSEQNYRWSNKHQSSIKFIWNDIIELKYNIDIVVDVLKVQKVRILLNGINVYENLVGGVDMHLRIENCILKKGQNNLTFFLPTAQQAGNGDSRLLALAFKSLTIGDVFMQLEKQVKLKPNLDGKPIRVLIPESLR